MRFLFVGGGTGGHLTPALGLAEALEARGHETLFLLSGRGVERSYFADGRSHQSLGIDSSRLPRVAALFPAMLRARRLAKRFRPHAVIALGGASSVAVLGIGRRRQRPLVLLEGNRVLGRSVQLLERFAARTLTMFEETAQQCRRGVQLGPVGRDHLQAVPAEQARRRLGLEPTLPTLLVMGGSQGARDLNRMAQDLLPQLQELGWQLLALVGAEKGAELRSAMEAQGLPGRCLEHCTEMGAAYGAADFALTRGGASTLGELWLQRLPAAVLPYPYHKDRQQQHNAEALAPGVLLLTEEPGQARQQVLACLADASRRTAMADALAGSAPQDGRRHGAQLLEAIASGKA